MTITKSISIAGIEGAGIDSGADDAITINIEKTDVVNLSHLTIDGLTTAKTGIQFISGGSLAITHCVVRNFRFRGISLAPTSATRFLIGDTLVSEIPGTGIVVIPGRTGSARGTLDHVVMNHNTNGLLVDGSGSFPGAEVNSVDSLATNNTDFGFQAQAGGILRLAHSAALGNASSVTILPDSLGESNGNNSISNVTGALNNVGTK